MTQVWVARRPKLAVEFSLCARLQSSQRNHGSHAASIPYHPRSALSRDSRWRDNANWINGRVSLFFARGEQRYQNRQRFSFPQSLSHHSTLPMFIFWLRFSRASSLASIPVTPQGFRFRRSSLIPTSSSSANIIIFWLLDNFLRFRLGCSMAFTCGRPSWVLSLSRNFGPWPMKCLIHVRVSVFLASSQRQELWEQ